MEPIDIGTADRLIRYHYRLREGRGRVLAKNPDGRTLQVDVFGKGATSCATERGVWGAVRVGDRVKVDTRTVPTVTGTYERFGPANQMQRVAEDFTEAVTDSDDTYVTLLDTGETLFIPPDSPFEVWWTSSAEVNGSSSTNQVNLRVVLNDIAGYPLTAGQPGQSSGERAFFTSYIPVAGFRVVGGQIGSFVYAAPVENITRVRLQGKTNAPDGLARLHAYGLAVFQ